MTHDPDPLGLKAAATRTAWASTTYAALKNAGRLKDHRLLTLRCSKRRCMLLDVVNVPGGAILHIPRYKLSPERNERSSSQRGRDANTEDGGPWRARTFAPQEADNVSLSCDHMVDIVVAKDELQRWIDSKTREVVIRPDGERQALD